ncbi:hypothetical protein FRB96_002540 [Tulasnella sp. 330]|nr:hypothetical protein FRB96_002540 [Tulasnella sp. 330]
MAVFSRIISTIALGSLIASVAGSPSGSSSGALKARHAEHARRDKSNNLATRGRHARRSDAKSSHCAAKRTTAVATSTGSAEADQSVPTTTSKAVVVTTTTSATQPATSTTSSGGGGSCGSTKAGLTWTDNSLNTQGQFTKSCWCYNWGSGYCSTESGIENVPMLWGNDGNRVSEWKAATAGKYFDHCLAFNEPDIGGQSNMSPQDAASAYQTNFVPANCGKRGTPATATGVKWLQEWMTACGNDCPWDFIPFHIYTVSSANAISVIKSFQAAWPDAELWITEIGCMDYSGNNEYCTDDMANSMMQDVKAYINSQPKITHWAWYQTATTTNIDISNSLMNSDGTPSDFYYSWFGNRYYSFLGHELEMLRLYWFGVVAFISLAKSSVLPATTTPATTASAWSDLDITADDPDITAADPDFTSYPTFPTQLTEPAHAAISIVSTITIVAAVIGGVSCLALICGLAMIIAQRRRRRSQLAALRALQAQYCYDDGAGGREKLDAIQVGTQPCGLNGFEISPYELPAPQQWQHGTKTDGENSVKL